MIHLWKSKIKTGLYQMHPLVKSEQAAASSSDRDQCVNALNPPVHIVTSRAGVPAEIDSSKSIQSRTIDTGVQTLDFYCKEGSPSIRAEKSSEDGYNWRKYGQKHVKGSEFPRSYYKCVHPNCKVKKQFERCHDGKIKDISYKGTHDHPKPLPKRIHEKSRFSYLTSSEDKAQNAHDQTPCHIEKDYTPKCPTVTASDDVHEKDEDDGDDPATKRRKQVIGRVDLIPKVKPTREPRVVVQTFSEVDILDDGYRWRKYGQKVVKGNPNPRSYYKCSNAGCQVRKLVERASHDLKAVLTTYEGKHNHDVPAAWTSSHDTVDPSYQSLSMNAVSGTRLEETGAVSHNLGVGISFSPDTYNRS